MIRVSLTMGNFARSSNGLEMDTRGLESKGPIGKGFWAMVS